MPDPITGQGDNRTPDNNYGFPLRNNEVPVCARCQILEAEIERLRNRISHADDLARDYVASDPNVYGRAMNAIRKALAGGE